MISLGGVSRDRTVSWRLCSLQPEAPMQANPQPALVTESCPVDFSLGGVAAALA